jgi:hypothetical protein
LLSTGTTLPFLSSTSDDRLEDLGIDGKVILECISE